MNLQLDYFLETALPLPTSYYGDRFSRLAKVINLQGYEGAQIHLLINKIAAHAAKLMEPVEVVHSCFNGSATALILPQLSTAIKSPEVFSENSLSYPWAKNLALYHSALRQLSLAKKLYNEGRDIHNRQEEIYIQNMNFSAANHILTKTIDKIFTNEISSESGKACHRFFGAALPQGSTNYIPSLTNGLKARYFIKGRAGTGKSTFLKKLNTAALNCGFNTELYHCSLDPQSIDMVIIRQLSLCFFDSTAPHEFFPEREGDEIIDLYESCVTPGTDEKYQNELNALNLAYKEKIKGAAIHLKELAKGIDEINSHAPLLLDTQLEEVSGFLISSLFN